MIRALRNSRFGKFFISLTQNQLSKTKMSAQLETMVEPQEICTVNKRPRNEENVDAVAVDADAKKQKVVDTKIKKRNYAMMLSYLGKDYYGMQRNPKMKTIEEDLINALFKAELINQEAFDTIQMINFQRAARTDKGVSATRQVVNLKMPETANIEIINQYLPNVIRVFGLKRVTKGFNSKIQCSARSYTYTLPTYAFAPDDPNSVRAPNTLTDDIDLEAREKFLSTINGKPYTDFRMTPELHERVNAILKLYEGTHNFHNFTSKVRPLDPRANRYIISFTCSKPYESQGTEFVSLEVKGQSFMLHQIRKMVALAIGIARNLASEETLLESFKTEKMDIPIVPGLGLVLHHVHYDIYNKRYGSDGLHEILDWSDTDDEIMKFYRQHILRHIEDTEIKEKSMFFWLVSLAMHTYGVRSPHHVKDKSEEETEQNEAQINV